MHEQYLSIKNPSSVELIIDKSRFICPDFYSLAGKLRDNLYEKLI